MKTGINKATSLTESKQCSTGDPGTLYEGSQKRIYCKILIDNKKDKFSTFNIHLSVNRCWKEGSTSRMNL